MKNGTRRKSRKKENGAQPTASALFCSKEGAMGKGRRGEKKVEKEKKETKAGSHPGQLTLCESRDRKRGKETLPYPRGKGGTNFT